MVYSAGCWARVRLARRRITRRISSRVRRATAGRISPAPTPGPRARTPDQAPPPTGISLSGSVYLDDDWSGARDNGEPGIEGAVLHLSGFDLQGNEVTQTVTTDADGHYTFSNLPAGTYQIMEDQPRYIDAWESVGTVNGETRGEILDNDLIGNITLGAGEVGVGYDFAEILNMPG